MECSDRSTRQCWVEPSRARPGGLDVTTVLAFVVKFHLKCENQTSY